MRTIAELERDPREVYCGAIGVVEPGGDCTFNVAIRTLWQDVAAGTAEYGAGGGITWDSTAEGEYDEALAKAALLDRDWPLFELLETLRLEDGAYHRFERHLDRIRRSAAYFGVPDPAPAARAALADHARVWPDGNRRVRLLVDQEGRARVESRPLADDDLGLPVPPRGAAARRLASPRAVALAREPVDRHDPFLCHKTTHREAYDRRMEPRSLRCPPPQPRGRS